jgi:hypothetical protein
LHNDVVSRTEGANATGEKRTPLDSFWKRAKKENPNFQKDGYRILAIRRHARALADRKPSMQKAR